MKVNKKRHWDYVYKTKAPNEISWQQSVPKTSLDFINSFNLPRTAKIIDIGGGDSRLVDYLIEQGYENITVLDISEEALNKARLRLGDKGRRVQWVVSDITKFHPEDTYDLWHDRATFHFLTRKDQVKSYLHTAESAISGYMVVATFSENGPEKCSGLPVKNYSEEQLQQQLENKFIKIRCIHEDHITPFQTIQNFLFCSFKKQNLPC